MKIQNFNTRIITFFISILSSISFSQENLTLIPSESAVPKGIVVDIISPESPRYTEGAPVIIMVVGGFDDNGLPVEKNLGLSQDGFIEIHFSWPGLGQVVKNIDYRSGGKYDYRGSDCLKSLRDVILFALEKRKDKQGRQLSYFTSGITPMTSNVGLIGFSNGGNATIAAAGIYGDSLSSMAWIVNYESPVGDGMPGAEAGADTAKRSSDLNPFHNKAYNSSDGTWDLHSLSYCDTVNINMARAGDGESGINGGLYFDFNQNGIPDYGKDFIVRPIIMKFFTDTLAYYSERLRQEAEDRNLIPSPGPGHIASLEATKEFWYWRNGEKWIQAAIDKIPNLMFLVFAFVRDHVQSALDHPHVLIQYDGFLKANARFVRLNPDKSYIEYVLGHDEPLAKDNDAFYEFDHVSIRDAMEPNQIIKSNLCAKASACELADRTYYKNLNPQIDDVLTSVERKKHLPVNFKLYQNYPNPFNNTTVIRFTLPKEENVFLGVYNIRGKLIRKILDQNCSVSDYDFEWNGENEQGEKVCSGIYYYELKTDSFKKTRKMVLVK